MKKAKIFALIACIMIVSVVGGQRVSAAGASLSFSPKSGTYAVGDTFTVKVLVDSGGGDGVNASEGTVNFDKSALSVLRTAKDGSVFTLWAVEPSFSNANGTISYGGGSPSAYMGSGGMVMTITFKALAEGNTSLSFSSSNVLSADGKGTDILSGTGEASYVVAAKKTIATPVITKPATVAPIRTSAGDISYGDTPDAPVVTSPTNPDENKWYPNANPKFIWNVPSDVTSVRTLFNKNPKSKPTVLSSKPITELVREKVEDGIWYAHVQLKNKSGWGEITHRKVMIDSKPPKVFQVTAKKKDSTDNYPVLLFNTDDDLSGVLYYEVKIGDGDPFQISVEKVKSNPYRMPYQTPGKHPIIVKAYDAAGNVTEAKAEIQVDGNGEPAPQDSNATDGQEGGMATLSDAERLNVILGSTAVALLLGSGILALLLWRRKKRYARKKKDIAQDVSVLRERVNEMISALQDEVSEQVRTFDDRPTISPAEKEVIEKLDEALDISKELIVKEIDGIEKSLE